MGETGINAHLDGIAHLWSLEQDDSENNTSIALEKASELGAVACLTWCKRWMRSSNVASSG